MSNFSSYKRKLQALCDERGWDLERGNGGHFRLSKPGVLGHITASATPRSENQALMNSQRLMKYAERSGDCGRISGDRAA